MTLDRFSLAAIFDPRSFLPSDLRPDHHCKYGVLLAHTMRQSEAVRNPTVRDAIILVISALCRTITAITALV
jgi:hypothetical protein